MFKYKEEMRIYMLANLLAWLGLGVATTGSQACHMVVLDEAECPESLIK